MTITGAYTFEFCMEKVILNQGVNFTYILQAAFLNKSVMSNFTLLKVCVCIFLGVRKFAAKTTFFSQKNTNTNCKYRKAAFVL